MALSENLVKEFADLMNDSTPVETEKSLYGTIKIVDEMSYVQLDGADEGTYTPIDSTVDVSDGDRVTVSIKRHSAVVTGNLTDPSAKTSVVGDINGKYSEISQSLDEIRSVIFGEDGSFSEMKQTVDALEFTITDPDGEFSKLKQTVEGFDITGLVKISDLENGTTTISGNCIETGTIKFSALESGLQTDMNAISTSASKITAWTYGDSTYIDGSKIMTGTVMASILQGGQINVLNANAIKVGEIICTEAQSSNDALHIGSLYGLRIVSCDGTLFLQSHHTDVNPGPYMQMDNIDISFGRGNVRPGSPNTFYCGTWEYPWLSIYSKDLILTSPNGSRYRVSVGDNGTLLTSQA